MDLTKMFLNRNEVFGNRNFIPFYRSVQQNSVLQVGPTEFDHLKFLSSVLCTYPRRMSHTRWIEIETNQQLN